MPHLPPPQVNPHSLFVTQMREEPRPFHIHSMTAFASLEAHTEAGLLIWDLRSVNSRFLDPALKLPEFAKPFEGDIRARISDQLKRGRLEATLTFRKKEEQGTTLSIDQSLVQSLAQTLLTLEADYPVFNARTPALELLRWPGVLKESENDRENLKVTVLSLLEQTLEQLKQARQREGTVLAEQIAGRCDEILLQAAHARARVPAVAAQLRQRLKDRLMDCDQLPDQNRLEQELVYFLHKMDISEELDRLTAHGREIKRLLESREPVGRRLDFLTQELNREANTLGSKSQDLEMTRVAVEMKVMLEQIREQVQNIE